MSISQLRTYFIARIRDIGPLFREHKDVFNPDNIPHSIIDKSFHILIANVASDTLDDQKITDNTNVTVRLFFTSPKNNQDIMDDALDTAHALRVASVKPINAMSGQNLKNVICTSIVPEFLGNNDNIIVIRLEFTCRMIFSAV